MLSRSPPKASNSYRSINFVLKKTTASPKNDGILQTTVTPVTVTVKRNEHIYPIDPLPSKSKKKVDVLKIRQHITEMTQQLSKNSWVNDPHISRERMFKQEFPNKVYMLGRRSIHDPFEVMTRHLALDPNYLEQTGKLKTSTITLRKFDLSLQPQTIPRKKTDSTQSPSDLLHHLSKEYLTPDQIDHLKQHNLHLKQFAQQNANKACLSNPPSSSTTDHEFFNPGNEVNLLIA